MGICCIRFLIAKMEKFYLLSVFEMSLTVTARVIALLTFKWSLFKVNGYSFRGSNSAIFMLPLFPIRVNS